MKVVIIGEAEEGVYRVEARIVCPSWPREGVGWVRFCSRGCIGGADAFMVLPVFFLALAGAVCSGLALGTAFEGLWKFCLDLEC